MRWSIIRLIWMRELRDQFRDRRTLFMIAGLPLVLYPALGVIVLTFALSFFERPSLIGLVRHHESHEAFPPHSGNPSGASPLLAATVVGQMATTSHLSSVPVAGIAVSDRFLTYRPLVRQSHWTPLDSGISGFEARMVASKLKPIWIDAADALALDEKRVDVLLDATSDFYAALEMEETGPLFRTEERPPALDADPRTPSRPGIVVKLRPNDDHSRQAWTRLKPILDRWRQELVVIRFVRTGHDARFDDPFFIDEPRTPSSADPEKIVDMVIRIFPFMLVMWSLAGALYPAVDLCAGEKERGTMETLLITPAGREEIVLGKFLTIWVFSAASALLNLFSMGITTWHFSALFPGGGFSLGSVFWCILLSLPLSALFSAISLAIGAYARSSKEGQYYLMPLFLVTMPLILLTLAPGVELNPFYSLVPVTGVALLMQKLMMSPSLAHVPWLYFIPVLMPIALYSALALRWAIDQFQREDVLFREAERLDISLWLKSILRDKEPTATAGQAFFCFALLLGLAWSSTGLGRSLPPLIHTAIGLLAFVATPALMMAVMLNTRPGDTLALRWPPARDLGLAAILAVLLLPPVVWVSRMLLDDYPQLRRLLDDPQPFIQELRTLTQGGHGNIPYLIVFALLPAICEELAFRGFILTGLCKRYRPRTAIFLASFMNALFHMNVFTFVPIFGISVVLGLLTVRSRSILPAMLFHVLSKGLLLWSNPIGRWIEEVTPAAVLEGWPFLVSACFVAAFVLFWRLYRIPRD